MVTLVTVGARTSNFVYYKNFNYLHFSILFGILKERLIFYELFCKGPSALRKYALTAVRGLKAIVTSTIV